MKSRPDSAPAAIRDSWLASAVVAALLLRCGLVALFPDPTPVNDEIDYWRLAEGLAREFTSALQSARKAAGFDVVSVDRTDMDAVKDSLGEPHPASQLCDCLYRKHHT